MLVCEAPTSVMLTTTRLWTAAQGSATTNTTGETFSQDIEELTWNLDRLELNLDNIK